MAKSNKLIIVTAPSASGKTSITKYLLSKFDKLVFCVSATTRKKRSNETNGKDYYFISMNDFQDKIRNNEFIEWEMVYNEMYYGTLKTELQRIWDEKKIALLDIDVKGAIHIQQQFPQESITLFIKPPSMEELKRRLRIRGTETEASLKDRLNKAGYEISFVDHFDKVVVNNKLEDACSEAEGIVAEFISH